LLLFLLFLVLNYQLPQQQLRLLAFKYVNPLVKPLVRQEEHVKLLVKLEDLVRQPASLVVRQDVSQVAVKLLVSLVLVKMLVSLVLLAKMLVRLTLLVRHNVKQVVKIVRELLVKPVSLLAR
jgi:hypothetical protein